MKNFLSVLSLRPMIQVLQ